MKFGKQKRHRRAVRFYTTCFGFRQPFKVLCDGTFIFNLVQYGVAPADEAISDALGGPVKLFTTGCIIAELERLLISKRKKKKKKKELEAVGDSCSSTLEEKKRKKELEGLGDLYSRTLDAAQMLAIARCDHEKKTSGATCIREIIGKNNPEHFFLATNDHDLREEFRKVPGVPRLFCLRNSLFLEKLSEFELQFVKDSEEERLHMAESDLSMLKKRAVITSVTKERKDSSDEDEGLVDEKSKMHDIKVRQAETKGMNVKEKVQFKRKKAKGPNPLSCKKKKSHGTPNPVSEKKSKGGENTVSRSRKRKRSSKGSKLVEANG